MKTSAEPISFEATVSTVAGHAIIRLPPAASDALPSRGQVAVDATVDGHAVTTVVEPDGHRGHWLKVAALGVELARGDEPTVELVPTKAWPEPDVPKDLRAALDDAPDLAETWESITPMARWEWVRWVGATRNADTRAKRVDLSIDKLRNGKRRPCCFDLSSCTDMDVARSSKLPADD